VAKFGQLGGDDVLTPQRVFGPHPADERSGEKLGLSQIGLAIYGLLHMPGGKARDAAESPYGKPDSAKTALAGLLEEHLAPHAEIVDWQMKDDVQREMRKVIKKHLRAAAYPAERVDSLAEGIVDLLKRRLPA